MSLSKFAETYVPESIRPFFFLSHPVEVVPNPPSALWSRTYTTGWDEIIGRCVNLQHPQKALTILANRPKYGVDIPSLSTARSLHSLCVSAQNNASTEVSSESSGSGSVTSSPFNDVLLLAALYPHYRLSEIYNDPVSLSMVLALCKSIGTDEARAVQEDLLEFANKERGKASVEAKASSKERRWAEEGESLLPYPVAWA